MNPPVHGLTACAAALALAACGSSDGGGDATASGPGGRYPLTIDNCGQKLTFERPPSRVLILNGASVGEVESFLMLGLGDRIHANAQHYGISDHPKMVRAIDALPRRGLKLNRSTDVPAEQVLELEPDLVVSTWSGGFDAKRGFATREQLAAAGINAYVNPVNCAYGNPSATSEQEAALKAASIESSYRFIAELGRIFDVRQRAAALIGRLKARIRAVRSRVAGKPRKRVLLAYPEMGAMNENGLPAVMTGGIYDDVIEAAGGVNVFASESPNTTRTLNKEQLAAARVEVLAIGQFTPGEDAAAQARKLFAAYPQWLASQTGTYTVVSDGPYLGPANAWAVEKIARVTHPVG